MVVGLTCTRCGTQQQVDPRAFTSAVDFHTNCISCGQELFGFVTPLNTEARESTYQPIASHGYGPHQLEEMKQFAAHMKPAR